jgi:hypothetical protein
MQDQTGSAVEERISRQMIFCGRSMPMIPPIASRGKPLIRFIRYQVVRLPLSLSSLMYFIPVKDARFLDDMLVGGLIF